MKDIEKIFSEKFKNNSWLGSESRSGPGSSLRNNVRLLSLLEDFVFTNKIKSIIDIGCGDFNWMRHFNLDLIDRYLGVDVVEELIAQLNIAMTGGAFPVPLSGRKKIKFKKIDVISEPILDSYDLVLCKDVLSHLSYTDSMSVIVNIVKSHSSYLVSTTFHDFVNKDIKTGQWRPVNLEEEPFLLGEPVLLWKNIEDKKTGWTNKSMGVWKL